ncbi:hypothetical protein Clacol_000156 [Clathrus columnatus]|uniref:F-box domain-containing protein n=1 Tax=Clathrus columnatus TaxID=1419009 RepID=A0AAV4ZWB0_9AGAM|nr:hypothetical protein Clacol_000156 [Clathrus columnatus]
MALPINRLPPEILVAIINLSLPRSANEFKPYPYFRYSWICRRWRSVALDNPMFWNRIVITHWSSKNMNHPMVREVLLRSHTLPLDFIIYKPVPAFHELGPHANRVRMLRIGHGVYNTLYPPSSYFTSILPSLKMLFLEYTNTTQLSIEPLPNLQALEVTVNNLGNLAIPHHFPNLWWLHLGYGGTMPLLLLLEALHNLPCLRVLYLFGGQRNPPDDLTITFHHLEALITNNSSILNLITAPKLIYLECILYLKTSSMSNENDNCLCGFDFSKITKLQIEINHKREVYIMGKVDTLDDDDMTPFSTKIDHRWAFNELTSSYPNEFYIQTDLPAISHLLSLFPVIVKESNNLDKIILKFLNLSERTSENNEEISFFLDGLRSAKNLRNLTVVGNDFVTFCEYLNDGRLCPNLERLAYSYYDQDSEEPDFLHPLLNLMVERSRICPQLLEVELTGFRTVPHGAPGPAERLGLRLIQN